MNPKRKAKLRGTIFSIALPKGGRGNSDLILREDELLVGEKRFLVKKLAKAKRVQNQQISDTLIGNYWAGGEGYGAAVSNLLYEDGAKGGKSTSKTKLHVDGIMIGHGRKNPNVVRKRTGNK